MIYLYCKETIMDYRKIGLFIENQRKNLNMTQAKLAEKLFVSDKTVSKWETGKGIPDTESLKRLSEIFGVSINDLLNGEKTNEENSSVKNEQLLLDMSKEIAAKNKIIWSTMWVLMGVCLLFLFSSLFVVAILIPEGPRLLVLTILITILFIIPCFYALKLEVSIGIYKCKECGTEIIPTYKQALMAPHMGTTRRFKCTTCNKKTWHRKVVK